MRVALAIFRKEMIDTFRDRRTIVTTLVIPVILYPLLITFAGSVASTDGSKAERKEAKIEIWGQTNHPRPSEIVDAIEQQLGEEVPFVGSSTHTPREAVRDHTVDVAVAISPVSETGYRAEVIYLGTEQSSQILAGRVVKALNSASEMIRDQRVSEAGLPEGFATPIEIREVDVSTDVEQSGDFAGRILPQLLLMMTFLGASAAAIDLTAGEKERGTMQTLLTAPVRPIEIVAGKYLTVVVVGSIAAILNLGAMSVSTARFAASVGEGGLSIPFDRVPQALLLFFPTVLLVSALLMVVSSFAASYREAQSYMSPLLIVIFLAAFLSFSDFALTPKLAFVPFVNVTLALRDVLRGVSSPFVPAAFVGGLMWAGLGVVAATKVFESEHVMLGGKKPLRAFVREGRSGSIRQVGGVPSGRTAVVVALVAIAVGYYAVQFSPFRSPASSLVMHQFVALLLPVLLVTALGKYSFRSTLNLRLPTVKQATGVVLVALGAWTVPAAVLAALATVDSSTKGFAESLPDLYSSIQGGRGLIFGLVVLAVVPAICEEFLFRGLVLSGLRSTGSVVGAVIGSSLLFGLFHVALPHVLAATVAGVVLSLVVIMSGSIWPAVLIHFANNAIAVLSTSSERGEAVLANPVAWAAAVLALVAGLLILKSARQTPAITSGI